MSTADNKNNNKKVAIPASEDSHLLAEVWKDLRSSLFFTMFKLSISLSFIAGILFAVGFYIWVAVNCDWFYAGWMLSGLSLFVLMGIIHDKFLKFLEALEKQETK